MLSLAHIGLGFAAPPQRAFNTSEPAPRFPYETTILAEGDSIFARTDARSIHNWLSLFLDGRLRFLPGITYGTHGNGGDDLQDIRDDIPEILGGDGPQIIFLNGGTNEPLTPETLDASKALAAEIIDTYNAAGVFMIYAAIPPRTDNSHNATREQTRLDFNEWLSGLAEEAGRDLMVVNFDDVYNPDDPDQSFDKLHPLATGARNMAAKVADALMPMIAERPADPIAGNLLTNPEMAGTSGTLATNVNGTVPTGWVIDNDTGADVQATIVAGDDGTNRVRLTITGSATASNKDLRIYQSVSHAVTIGDILEGQCFSKISGTEGAPLPTGISAFDVSGFKSQLFSRYNPSSSGRMNFPVENHMRTMPYVQTQNASSAQFGFYMRFEVGSVSAEIEFGVPSLIQL